MRERGEGGRRGGSAKRCLRREEVKSRPSLPLLRYHVARGTATLGAAPAHLSLTQRPDDIDFRFQFTLRSSMVFASLQQTIPPSFCEARTLTLSLLQLPLRPRNNGQVEHLNAAVKSLIHAQISHLLRRHVSPTTDCIACGGAGVGTFRVVEMTHPNIDCWTDRETSSNNPIALWTFFLHKTELRISGVLPHVGYGRASGGPHSADGEVPCMVPLIAPAVTKTGDKFALSQFRISRLDRSRSPPIPINVHCAC